MSDVFILEASMHAYKMLGYGPLAKAELEKRFGKIAFEMGCVMRGQAWDAMWDNGYKDPPDKRIAAYVQYNSEEWEPWARRIRASAQTREQIRKRWQEFRAADTVRATVLFGEIVSAATDMPQPAGYQEADSLLDLEGGWRWAQVSDPDCQDYEGHMMQHCGTPMQNMASLRDPQGKPHVTVDLDMGYRTILQLRGKQNTSVAPKYWSQVNELLKYLKTINGKPFVFDDSLYGETDNGLAFLDQAEKAGLLTFNGQNPEEPPEPPYIDGHPDLPW